MIRTFSSRRRITGEVLRFCDSVYREARSEQHSSDVDQVRRELPADRGARARGGAGCSKAETPADSYEAGPRSPRPSEDGEDETGRREQDLVVVLPSQHPGGEPNGRGRGPARDLVGPDTPPYKVPMVEGRAPVPPSSALARSLTCASDEVRRGSGTSRRSRRAWRTRNARNATSGWSQTDVRFGQREQAVS